LNFKWLLCFKFDEQFTDSCPFKQFRSKAVLLLSAMTGRTYGTGKK